MSGCTRWVTLPAVTPAEVARCAEDGGRTLSLRSVGAAWCVFGGCTARSWQASRAFSVAVRIDGLLAQNGSTPQEPLQELLPFAQLPIDFVIAGFPKSATTTLFASLRRHPHVLFPSPAKEESIFFAARSKRELRELESRFRNAAKEKGTEEDHAAAGRRPVLRGLFSPMMVLHREAMTALDSLPLARAIVLVRDPIELVQSWLDTGVWPAWMCKALDLSVFLQSAVIRKTSWRLAREGRLLVLPFDAVRYAPSLVWRAVARFLNIEIVSGAQFMMLPQMNPTLHGPWRKINVCSERAGLNLWQVLRQAFAHEYGQLHALLRRFFLPFANMTGQKELSLSIAETRTSRPLLLPMACPQVHMRRRRVHAHRWLEEFTGCKLASLCAVSHDSHVLDVARAQYCLSFLHERTCAAPEKASDASLPQVGVALSEDEKAACCRQVPNVLKAAISAATTQLSKALCAGVSRHGCCIAAGSSRRGGGVCLTSPVYPSEATPAKSFDSNSECCETGVLKSQRADGELEVFWT